MAETARIIEFPVERRFREPLLTTKDLIARYGFSERWWRYRIAEPGFPKRRWGGQWRFLASEVEAYMERSHHAGS